MIPSGEYTVGSVPDECKNCVGASCGSVQCRRPDTCQPGSLATASSTDESVCDIEKDNANCPMMYCRDSKRFLCLFAVSFVFFYSSWFSVGWLGRWSKCSSVHALPSTNQRALRQDRHLYRVVRRRARTVGRATFGLPQPWLCATHRLPTRHLTREHSAGRRLLC